MDSSILPDRAAGRGGPRTGASLLWRELRPVWASAAAALAVLIVSVLATLAAPLLVQVFVDRATDGAAEGALLHVALGYLALAVFAGATRVCASLLGVRCGWRIADSLRVRLLRHATVAAPVLRIESRSVGEVLEKVEGNADVVGRSIAESGFRLIGNVAVAAGAIGFMFFVVPIAGLGMTVLVVAVCFVLNRLSRVAVGRWERARDQAAEVFGFIGDALGASADLQPLGESGWAVEQVDRDLANLYRIEGRAYIYGRAFWPLTQLFIALAFGLGFGAGLRQLQHGAISIGALTVIYLYIDLLQKPLEEVSSQAGQMQQMMAVLSIAARTLQPADQAPATAPAPAGAGAAGGAAADGNAARLPEGPLPLAFEDVTFGYGGTPVLHGVSFNVAAGASLGIVGRTGAGKSTIVNLLCGLARPDRGRVLIGGVDASELSPAEFARRVTVMSQRAHVFGATVRENLTLFDAEVPDARIWEVLGRLGAAEWIKALPEGLDTPVGAGGRTLSEGELQLLAGARALMRPYSLLVVDEGTSRLDPVTEESWSALLDTVMRDRTVVIVEHRWGTLRSVDEVLFMSDGRVEDLMPGAQARRTREAAR